MFSERGDEWAAHVIQLVFAGRMSQTLRARAGRTRVRAICQGHRISV